MQDAELKQKKTAVLVFHSAFCILHSALKRCVLLLHARRVAQQGQFAPVYPSASGSMKCSNSAPFARVTAAFLRPDSGHATHADWAMILEMRSSSWRFVPEEIALKLRRGKGLRHIRAGACFVPCGLGPLFA
jgi:hypothetical protein